jgi:hypothetical protein
MGDLSIDLNVWVILKHVKQGVRMRNGQGVGRAQAKMVTDTWGSRQPAEYLNQLCDYHIVSIYTPPYIQLSPYTYNVLGVESHPCCHSYQRRHILFCTFMIGVTPMFS